MSSCLSGGAGRTYGFDLDIVKPTTSTSTRTSNSSSPSSTISESINSPLAISTRKPRTPRKRPNQTYNEAAALLSTVYPNIFSTKNLRRPSKNTKAAYDYSYSEEFSELLPPSPSFQNTEFLLHQPISTEQPRFRIAPKPSNSSEKPTTGCDFRLSSLSPSRPYEEDLDAESILDEEMEEGIDSIMGNLSVDNYEFDPYSYYQNPMGFDFFGKFDFGFGLGGGIKPLIHVDEGDWWRRFPTTVDVLAITPKQNKVTLVKKSDKKKKKKVEKEANNSESLKDMSPELNLSSSLSLGLKLSYGNVLNAWSDRGSPFSDDILGSELSESTEAIARLMQMDLFSENGGLREASVLRYREKRRSRLFSKKIRYQVRKVNADRRPRMKAIPNYSFGRFVRRLTSAIGQEMKRKLT
ncbi:hypothetical protein GIB67_034714 [Kingdonia uniflora]|uniref:CCT domain-containing protein n=1 Tax=Kingdonia uniflora TaxID=39325 RepID=A0A7J7ML37_9MAGN|nr:hypothetical protein GIB67_034714 [Kingdonia uniflora]